MWSEIMLANRDAILGELDLMIDELREWREGLAGFDKEKLYRFLCEARESREKIL